ncbi:MAG: ABC transporter permease [Bacteroidales bacterium]|nr:ABC transporter permease [Bacteroidales bacterium]
MQFERFIARRFMPRRGDASGFSGPLSGIAVAGIALGVTVMVMAVSILRGFQKDITDKVVGFGSHITVTSYDRIQAYAESPVSLDSALLEAMRATPGVKHVQCYASKGGMVKTEDQIYGIVLRGLDKDYDTTFFAGCLTEGSLPKIPSNEVLISSTIGSKLGLKVGDKMRTYFWQGDSYRARAFTVSGIYNTDLTEMDELYVVGSLATVQKLNDWVVGDSNGANGAPAPQVGGYEVLVDDLKALDPTASRILSILPYDLMLTTVTQAHPALFSWLDLLNANITLILAIMCLVSAVAIVSALLIMIFEKSATIGLLKALGACNRSVRRIFLIKSMRLILWGIALGDGLALALSAAQQQWQLVQLDAESYSMSHVPVLIDPWVYVLVSAGTLAICLLALLLPVATVSRISPARTMRVEK